MSNFKRLLLYPFAIVLIAFLKTLGFVIFKNSKCKRMIALSSAYADITSARVKSINRQDYQRDYDALANIGISMGITEQRSGIELPLGLQRFISYVLNRNLFWDDKMIIDMIDTINKDQTQSSVDKFAQQLYDKAPVFLKYGNRNDMINDLRKVVLAILPIKAV